MSATPVEIAQLWRYVHRHMRLLFRKTAETHPFPSLSLLLLRHIRNDPGITVSELARRVGASKSHTSTLTEQLVQKEYVSKRSNPDDQRIVSLFVTSQGERELKRMDKRAERVWTSIFEEFPADELENIERLLKGLYESLERVHTQFQSRLEDGPSVHTRP